jgi:hypothetical protein
MAKKPRLTKKDSYILLLGVIFSFLFQMAYDVAHEFANFETESLNWYWVSLQFCFVVLFCFLAFGILRKVEQE